MNINKTKQRGYAILFTMVLVGIISTIALGLANVTYKQLILSSVAKDSQISFYEADMASECALYAESKLSMTRSFTPNPWSCGIIGIEGVGAGSSSYDLNIIPYGTSGYSLVPQNSTSLSPCFNITANKDLPTLKLISKGYNICNKTNLRTVEREVDVSF